MLDVDLPEAGPEPPAVRSFQACLASLLEVAVDEVPAAEADLDAAVSQWRTWLAGRDLGLVPVADASTFQWPGFWVAVLEAGQGVREDCVVLMFGTPAGVVLSPQDRRLLGRAAAGLPVRAGYVVAACDPVVPSPAAAPRTEGRAESVLVAERAEDPMRQVSSARAIPGRGLEGDRYAAGAGTFTPRGGGRGGYDLTLVEAEVLEGLVLPGGRRLGHEEARRNVVTRGVDLNALVGRRFRVGEVECLGRRLCEPCAHLERLTHPGVLRGLIHRGGLRADILTPGVIHQGAVVRGLDETARAPDARSAHGSIPTS